MEKAISYNITQLFSRIITNLSGLRAKCILNKDLQFRESRDLKELSIAIRYALASQWQESRLTFRPVFRLHALTLVGPTRDNLVQDPLAVLHLNN